MNPENVFCPNLDCPARGQVGKGNIRIHSQKEQRYVCTECGKTFSASKGTIFYRLRTDPKIVMIVLVLIANGCPIPAIVKAFGFDERTVKNWWQRAGEHAQEVHDHVIGQSQLDLGQVQADEIKVKAFGRTLWMAFAIMVSTRLWLGGAVSPRRDQALIQRVVAQVRRIAQFGPLLVAIDGLPSYVSAFRKAFRTPIKMGHGQGRPRLFPWPDLVMVQVIKRRVKGRLDIERRIVQGSERLLQDLLQRTQQGGGINTAFIERLNATFRQRLPWLTRRTRTLAQQSQTLTAAMYVVGALYNLCDYHHSLRVKLYTSPHHFKWVQRTPAMAAGLTDHRWSYEELFSFKVPPPRWTPPKKRGRPSKETLMLIEKWC